MQDFRNFFEIFSIFCGFSPLCAVLRPVLPCYGFLSLYIRYGAREKNCVKKLKFAENYDIILLYSISRRTKQ